MPRKRAFEEVDAVEPPQEEKAPSLVQKIRNMWEVACVMQFIFMFGKALKMDEDFDIEDFENECLKPGYSEKLEEIGLTLLKWISSHRGLNYEIWDEYTRRQYNAKAPNKPNPYGNEEEPKKFREFDIFTKIRVLHQLTVWTFHNPDKLRALMPEQKESEQLDWRINIFGWDEDDREYYLLDDNRLYRRTEPPLPPAPKAKPKAKTLKAQATRRRVSKRRKIEESEVDTDNHDEEEVSHLDIPPESEQLPSSEIDTFGGYKWECVAITMQDYEEFINTLRTKPAKEYPNEREMRERLNDEVMPVIRELAEKQRRKQERRERELMFMEKMAGAKRSSRLAGKLEREQKEREEFEAARKRAADLAEAHREQARQEQMEQDRQSRMMTREQRIKDREQKRLLMEEQLLRDAEEQKRIEEGDKRGSERHIRDRIEKNRKELEELENEDDWTFDCSGCGVHGKNIDDGSHSIACEKCNVWQHSKCLGIAKSAAERDDFTFVCQDCRRREEEAKRPKITLKFRSGPSSSPPQQHIESSKTNGPVFVGVDVPNISDIRQPQFISNTNGHTTQQASPRVSFSEHTNTTSTPHLSNQALAERVLQPMDRNMHQHQPQHMTNGFGSQVSSSSDASMSSQSQQNTNGDRRVYSYPYQTASHPNGVSHQQYNNSSQSSQIHSTPRPLSAHGTGPSPAANRLPSPIINRPTMSPTQGNPDVGPIAGVPGSSPTSYDPALFTPQANGSGSTSRYINGGSHQSSSQTAPPSSPPSRLSQTPQPQSGLSPVKHRVNSSFPPPSIIPDKRTSMSPPPQPSLSARSVSGTPIFPPAENLAPSPQQLNRDPVPTPSKQPLMPGESMDGIERSHQNGMQ